MSATHEFDPITLEIIQTGLQATADEMFAAMRRTSMSAIIYEVLDMGTGITDAEGQLASSGAGIPAFIGVLDKAVQRIIEVNGDEPVRDGDVFATNDPFYGGVTHLNDIVLAMPVFADGEVVAWAANIAHWNDVGGLVPGSISTEAEQLFQEGLRLPAVKLIDAGHPNRGVMRIMEVNSRLPDFLRGDMWAGIAAVRIGAERLREMAAKYGRDTFSAAMAEFMRYGEQVSLQALADLPVGTYQLEERQDSGAVYRVTVRVSPEEFLVDLRDNPDQDPGPNNASRDGAIVAAQMIFKALTDPTGSATGGSFRPLTVLTRPGSVFDAREPAAFGLYYEVEIRLYDLIWRCLAPHLDGRLPAGHFASICGTIIGGPHPDTGKHFTIVEPQIGGWGASAQRDGNTAIFSGFHGETFNCPAEVAETRYGLIVDRLALNDVPGGEGAFRGGKGIVVEYRVRQDGCFLTCAYTRNKHMPWPAQGGREGSPNVVEVIRADGSTEEHAVVTALALNEGDVIRIRTGAGGGYGDPQARDPDSVRQDIENELITPDRARDIYGYARG